MSDCRFSIVANSRDVPWDALVKEYGIDKHDFNQKPFYITAKQIKAVVDEMKGLTTTQKEVRTLAYQAKKSERPKFFVDNGLFILPVKNGKYAIIRGEGYIEIPEISSPLIDFRSRMEFELITSGIGDSESQHLDSAFNSGILDDFVDRGRLFLTIRGRKRTPEFDFSVDKHKITAERGVQTEADGGYESTDAIVIVEGKNTNVSNTLIRQLYYPYRMWRINTENKKDVIPIFFEKKDEEYMFWMFEFTDPDDYNSIRLVRSARYRLTIS
tara:strand:+ start:175 stop:984 length:810 start_codon:yes stop_codon:yes gene_type:complete